MSIPTLQNRAAPGFPPSAPRTPAPRAWQPAPQSAAPQRAMPVNAAMATDAAPRPIIRAQSADAPTQGTAPFVLATPEALGLAPARQVAAPTAPDIDWNEVRTRLRNLGATAFHVDQVSAGQWRATLTHPRPGQQPRQLEAYAASDSAALLNVLQQAEAAATQRR